MSLMHETAIFLIAAIIAVSLFNRLGFGSVLGYLAAGLLIGPWGFGLISEVDRILHFAELGVVLLLFIFGLELKPSRLWVLRHSVFGFGLAQVLVTAAVLAAFGQALGLPLEGAIVAGLALALSSTAFVVQMLAEKKQLTTVHGRAAFSVLLFQDLAVIPILAILPLLGTAAVPDGADALVGALKIAAVIAGLVLGGHFVLRYALRFIAASGSHEMLTAAALLVVIGSALLMELAGLSMALGAFLAGMLLAESEFRHELEANIEPFKRLLLGLFFIAVGMSTNIGLIASEPAQVLMLVSGLLLVKFVVLFALARLFGHSSECARNLAFVLPQGGEFAFVIFNLAMGERLLSRELSDLLIGVVTLSMVATPLLVLFNEAVVGRWLKRPAPPAFDPFDGDTDHKVVIAGFGRFGQVIGRMLQMRRIPFTAIEVNPDQVQVVRRYGNKVYYGDVSRLELLQAAQLHKAKVFVIAINDVAASVRAAETAKRYFPNVHIYAEARDRHHAHLLMDVGVTYLIRETFHSALEMGTHVLQALGESEERARQLREIFRQHDEATLARQHAIYHDETKLIQSAKDAVRELEELFEADTRPQRRLDAAAGD